MIKKTYLLRLVLDFLAAGLLLAALAYYWLDNTAHELIGTGIFALILVHNVFNRRWYGALPQSRVQTRNVMDRVLTLSLLAAMLVLLVTSVMISRAVFSFLQINGGFNVRQIHTLAAYWALIFVAIHLGLRWQRVMNAIATALNVVEKSLARTIALRLIAAGVAVHGLQSSFVMGVGSKLASQMSLDGWDFEASTFGFFLNWVSIVGLYIIATHYASSWIQKKAHKAAQTLPMAET